MSELNATFFIQLLQIVWIDILLSGDNAVVIALACRNLPEDKRRLGIALGAGAAVVLRILFMLLVVQLLKIPFLKVVGGLLLLWIAVQLVTGSKGHGEIKANPNLMGAVTTIMIADGVMSLDNVLAIVGVAHGSTTLIVIGLLLSIPLVVFGAGAVMKMIDRWPILIWAGAALLGWVAGEMLASDPQLEELLKRIGDPPDLVFAIGGAVLVVAIAWMVQKLRPSAETH